MRHVTKPVTLSPAQRDDLHRLALEVGPCGTIPENPEPCTHPTCNLARYVLSIRNRRRHPGEV